MIINVSCKIDVMKNVIKINFFLILCLVFSSCDEKQDKKEFDAHPRLVVRLVA